MFHKKAILNVLGAVMLIVGAALIVPALTAVYFHDSVSLKAFLICSLPMLIAGALIVWRIRPESRKLSSRDGFIIVASAWVLFSVLGALPFVISGAIPGFPDAFFETASGFSTTGASILTDVEALPKSMLLWRSFTHWLGGMGVLVLTVALLPMLGIGGQKIMRAETTGPTMDKTNATFSDSARAMYIIYVGMTVVEFVLLKAGGMGWYDAFIHTVGTVGTGGFSNYGASVGHFGNLYLELVIAVFMLFAGVNFGLYYKLFTGKVRQVFQDVELRAYLMIVAGSTVGITVILYMNDVAGFGTALRQSFFQVSSLVTSTGYATANFDIWPLAAKMILFFLMLVGGCAGSTGGGLKVIRALLYGKLITRSIKKKLHPNAVYPVKIGGKTISEDVITASSGHLILYAVITCISCFVISFENIDFETCITSVITCLSNMGPGFSLVGPAGNFAFYSGFSKILFGMLMIAGRLELYTIILMFLPSFWNKNK